MSTEKDYLENMRKEKEKTISKINREQLKDVGDEFPEIDEIASDDQDPSELTSGTDDRDTKGSGVEIEPVVKDPRFSKKHEFAPETLDPLNTGTSKTKKIVPDPDDEPEVDEETGDSEETE